MTEDSRKVRIADIAEVLGASIEVKDTLDLAVFEVGSESFTVREPIAYDLTVTNTGAGIVAMGHVVAPVMATCARCLCEFPTEIEAEVDGFYVRPGQEADLPEEQEVEFIDAEDSIDVLPAVMAALVLEAPFAPLHDENCAGICAQCGADLNEGPCGCAEPADLTHPFAALKDLTDRS